ncbi:helix-turn-helix domain-containing protein [Faecalicoccus pleomorphus]|uniref:helix-turn-helix domain-containing protein n=1 Tax=Faecalicoccus pleomorphus TaxID=1323 RepID=UPI003DA2D48D
METIGDRIKQVRKELNLSMEKFGDKIGIVKSAINNIEKGLNNPSERTLKLICSEFNVNYAWLTEGQGDMFVEIPDNILDRLIQEYDLEEDNKPILKAYLEAKPETRKEILKFIHSLTEEINKMAKEKSS